jgi:hypothetical protein
MGGGSENTISSMTGAIISVAGVAVLATLAFPFIGNQYGSSGPENLYNCEKHTIKQCDVKKNPPGMIDCLFTNNSRVSVAPDKLVVWNYDSEGIVTDTNNVSSDGVVPPGETVHIEFFTDKDAHESVICSIDPDSPQSTRSTWTLVKNSGG